MYVSPERGGKCRACETIGARMCTQVRIVLSIFLIFISILTFLLTLAPFGNLSVDTFPDKRGQLKDLHSFFYFLSSGDGLHSLFFLSFI